MDNRWIKFLCAFVGWDYNILNKCTPASCKTLHRYAGAIFLLMLLWFYIGYGMANRYFKIGSIFSKVWVSFAFSFIIWIVERQIILIVGKNVVIGWVRIGLACIMALLGATIIDQTLFGNDIDTQIDKIVEERTDRLFESRNRIIGKELVQNQKELDSLENKAWLLSNELSKRPMIKTILYTKSPTGHVDSLGNPIMANGYIQENVPNPKKEDQKRVNTLIDNVRANMALLNKKQQALRDEIRKEVKDKIGLLTELEVTFSKDVIFSGWASGLFYFVVFLFFLLIETLVVTGKIFSVPCDYEVLIERQQKKRKRDIYTMLPLPSAKFEFEEEKEK